MIKTIHAYVLYRKDYGDDRDYSISRFEMAPYGYTTLSEADFEVEIPDDFDPRQQQVAILKKERERINKEFADRCRKIDEEINKLIAIEYQGVNDESVLST